MTQADSVHSTPPINTSAVNPADSVLEAIEAHKAARVALSAAASLNLALDRELPIEKCRSHINVWEETIVETDDPRWIEAERTVMRCMNAENDAACVMIRIRPTTMAGVLALLRYAVDADSDGEGWPPIVQPGDARSWHHFLIANLAEVLPELAAGKTS